MGCGRCPDLGAMPKGGGRHATEGEDERSGLRHDVERGAAGGGEADELQRCLADHLRRTSEKSCCRKRLETPFGLLTNLESCTVGGGPTNRCAGSSSPFISF